MKLTDISGIAANAGASEADVLALEKLLGVTLPDGYVSLLMETNGFALNNGVTVYPAEDVLERNETFEVREYAPGFLAIGDDSGGLSILVDLATQEVFSVDQGSMDPDDMEHLADSIQAWVSGGCNV